MKNSRQSIFESSSQGHFRAIPAQSFFRLALRSWAVAFLVAMVTPCLVTGLTAASKDAPNVLMIAVDDLKPWLGAYGHTDIKTPNIDALAKKGVTFTNAHCQMAVCGPSRASVMTGLRPDNTKVWDLKTKMRKVNPKIVSMPEHFRNQGYITAAVGKIYDPRCVDGYVKHDAPSWTLPYGVPMESENSAFGHLDPEFVAQSKKVKAQLQAEKKYSYGNHLAAMGGQPATEGHMDVPDEAYQDGDIARQGIELLKRVNKKGINKPFFLAVGFKKPHLPFVAPKKYWDMYDREQLVLEDRKTLPHNAPELHFQDSWELKNGTYRTETDAQGRFTESFQKEMIHGYMACISYMDAQVGKLMAALEASGEADNTVVVLWGDHGFHLGDHGMWCKHTNYEQATRSPFIMVDPREAFAMTHSDEPVEFVDLFPSLCDMADLKRPENLDGRSLLPHLRSGLPHKRVAMSQFPRHNGKGEVMGYAYRSKRYRYIEWVDNKFKQGKLKKAPRIAEELYDYETDPREMKNMAQDSAYASIVAGFRALAVEMQVSGSFER